MKWKEHEPSCYAVTHLFEVCHDLLNLFSPFLTVFVCLLYFITSRNKVCVNACVSWQNVVLVTLNVGGTTSEAAKILYF